MKVEVAPIAKRGHRSVRPKPYHINTSSSKLIRSLSFLNGCSVRHKIPAKVYCFTENMASAGKIYKQATNVTLLTTHNWYACDGRKSIITRSS